MSNRPDRRLKRQAKIKKRNQKQKESKSLSKNKKMRNLLRDRLLNHIKTYDPPYYLYQQLGENEVLFMITNNTTQYGISGFEAVLDLISNDSTRDETLAFMKVNQDAGNKLVVFQEDYEPVILFAFEPQEIERKSLAESEVI